METKSYKDFIQLQLRNIDYKIQQIEEHGIGDSDSEKEKYFLIKERNKLLIDYEKN